MTTKDRSDTWDGGYKRRNAKGKKVFIIYKKVRGKLYELSTRCTSSAAANEHWKRFQTDPEAYRPEGEEQQGALLLDRELGREFLLWSRDVKRNSPTWIRDQKHALAWWQEKLEGQDLRKLKTSRLLAALDGIATGRKQRIATLKTFYGWLRKERHLIMTSEDPLFGQVRVPQSRVAQQQVIKAITLEEFRAALAKLEGWPRDALEVLGATGWHVTELKRFAESGAIEKHPHSGDPVLLCPRTKSGSLLRTQVDEQVSEAARRLREQGSVDYFELRKAIRATGATFNPGYMRHSVATWAVNAGAEPGAVSAFLNHFSLATTKKFYATHAVPAKVPTLSDHGGQ